MIKIYKIILIVILCIAAIYYFQKNIKNTDYNFDQNPKVSSSYDSIINARKKTLIKNDSIHNEWKKIFYVLATEEDRVLLKAENKFKPSEFEEHANYTQKEIERIRIRTKKKHNLSDSMLNKIVYQGVKNKWPFQSSF